MLSTLLALLLFSVTAPLTESQLLERSTLVIDGHCTGVTYVRRTDSERLRSITWDCRVEVDKVWKGKPVRTVTVRGAQVLHQNYMGDAPRPALRPGWAGRLYLSPDKRGTFQVVHWSGLKEDPKRSRPRAFPAP